MMAYMRGLELVCIGKTHSFEIHYKMVYKDNHGREIEDLLDMCCFNCGASYYTLDGAEQIDFCPNCGRFERLNFKTLGELLEWSHGQNFDFLRYSSNKAFAVKAGSSWGAQVAHDIAELRRRGITGEIHEV